MSSTAPLSRSVDACPACAAPGLQVFYGLDGAPVHSVLLLAGRDEALAYPRGAIRLGFCPACGFVANLAFDPALQEYSARYEATQAYSETFNAFHRRLASDLIERFELRGKRILEIGCGQGEFLSLLCELGGNQGLGYDTAHAPERLAAPPPPDVVFIRDFFPGAGHLATATEPFDLICCKMTLEHIGPVAGFIDKIRRSILPESGTAVFFQVPNARYVFGRVAFWDVYYEHASYFTTGTLARLFRRSGFEVLDLWTDYNDQYLMISARAGGYETGAPLPAEADLEATAAEIARFQELAPIRIAAWRERLRGLKAEGRRALLWGGGSKAVSFLTTLGPEEEWVLAAVDINPYKAGSFLPGVGLEVIPPADLPAIRPEVVIAMNPIYIPEIRLSLERLRLEPELWTVEDTWA